MAPERLIDSDTRTRNKPMRVLVLGMCRTGTSSIKAALGRLGYNAHHMVNILHGGEGLALWHEAVTVTFLPDSERPAHLRGAAPYGRAEFDKLLADYDAVTDVPSALFVDQLTKAYPDAKVVLTNRAYDSWARSMRASIWNIFRRKLPSFCMRWNVTPFAPFLRFVHTIFHVHSGNHYDDEVSRAAFEKHYAHVRSVVPKQNLLEFGPKFSWEPLCEFLGHEVPNEPYPHVNDAEEMRKRLDGMWWFMAVYLTGLVAVPIGVGAGLWYWRDGVMAFLRTSVGREL